MLNKEVKGVDSKPIIRMFAYSTSVTLYRSGSPNTVIHSWQQGSVKEISVAPGTYEFVTGYIDQKFTDLGSSMAINPFPLYDRKEFVIYPGDYLNVRFC